MEVEREFPRWAPALLLTLVLHLGAGLAMRHLDLFGAGVPNPREPDLVEVVFAPPQDALPDPIHQFTELPPDRADSPPDRTDLLSNVDSRARDTTPGGSDDLARQEGSTEFRQVQLDSGRPSPASIESEPSPAAEERPETPLEPNEETPDETTERDRDRTEAPPFATPVPNSRKPRTDAADPWAEFRQERAASSPVAPAPRSSPSTPSAGGASDLAQPAMAAPDANAEFPGDISLNTRAWDFAPWLLAFRRELMASWTAPLGYHLGLIHGWTLLEVVVAPNGEVISSQVLGEEGNVAFRQSSLAAIERSMPYLPLPDDFPEPTLILTIRMAYPEWQPTPTPQRRPTGGRR